MPRKGHKVGCQCAICKRMDAKLATPLVETRIEVIPEDILTFRRVMIGGFFQYQEQMYKKSSNFGAINLNVGGIGDGDVRFEANTIVEPPPPPRTKNLED